MTKVDQSKFVPEETGQATLIEEEYKRRVDIPKRAGQRAWAIVNKIHGGGEKPRGSGHGKGINRSPYLKGGKLGGKASARRPFAKRSASARKAAGTRARRR